MATTYAITAKAHIPAMTPIVPSISSPKHHLRIALANDTNAGSPSTLKKVLHAVAIVLILVATVFLFKAKVILGAIALLPAAWAAKSLAQVFGNSSTDEATATKLDEASLKNNPTFKVFKNNITDEAFTERRRTDCQTEDELFKITEKQMNYPCEWGTLNDGRAYILLKYKLHQETMMNTIDGQGVCVLTMETAKEGASWKAGGNPRFQTFLTNLKKDDRYKSLSDDQLIQEMLSRTLSRGVSSAFLGATTELSHKSGVANRGNTWMILQTTP